MNRANLAPAAFMVAFCIGYAVAFFLNWPMFIYYPLHGDFNWGPVVRKGIGPGMAWYGLLADAGVVAALAAACTLKGRLDGRRAGYLWVFPVGAMLICVFLLKHFFS